MKIDQEYYRKSNMENGEVCVNLFFANLQNDVLNEKYA